MRRLSNIKWLPFLMIVTVIAIGAFQYYWLDKAFKRERRTLEMRTNFMFRETVFTLQGKKLKFDKLVGDTSPTAKAVIAQAYGPNGSKLSEQKVVGMVDVLTKKAKDSTSGAFIIRGSDTLKVSGRNLQGRHNRLLQFLFDIDSIQDPVKPREIETAFKEKLAAQNITLPFSVKRVTANEDDEPQFNQVTLGFSKPITYELQLGDTVPFLLKRISVPILFSVFLIALTIVSFSLLYRTLLRQRKLSEIKNELISNITHELKTPIATVSVAIEALQNFDISQDVHRTQEYLAISANELQRLSLLVDKVLKLSMFEKREIELRYEKVDMQELVNEVAASMRLQFERKNALVQVTAEGNTLLEADRLHLVSVIFNLLDNALKYSNGNPHVKINIKGTAGKVQVVLTDSGIGIPSEYHTKIFEKFFRVPTGNLHNAKGYGLGLSYVFHVIKKHHGAIRVESVEGDGSRFYITLPKHAAANN